MEEEKERYSLQEFGGDIDCKIAIVDNKLCKALSFEKIKNLLNQQDLIIRTLKNKYEDRKKFFISTINSLYTLISNLLEEK